MNDYGKMEALIREQEDGLWFDSFDNDDALRLGLMFIDEAKRRGIPIAILIRKGDLCVFSYMSEGTSGHNADWLVRKANSVSKLNMSTLRLYWYLLSSERDMQNDMYLDPWVYGIKGGGFPIRVKGTGLVGSVCVSSLPHEEDHRLIVDVLSSYLGLV